MQILLCEVTSLGETCVADTRARKCSSKPSTYILSLIYRSFETTVGGVSPLPPGSLAPAKGPRGLKPRQSFPRLLLSFLEPKNHSLKLKVRVFT